MPRKRQIDPSIWTSSQFIKLSDPYARLLFIGMISHADDEGRLKGDALYLRVAVFPGDDMPLSSIEAWRDQIAEQGLITVYKNTDNEYIYLPTFQKHQYMTKRFPSRLPPPQPVNNQSMSTQQPVNNELHEVEVGNGNGSGSGSGSGSGTQPVNNELYTTTTPQTFEAWEQATGRPITGFEGEELKALIDVYSDTWTVSAIREAARSGIEKVRIRYIERILERWKAEGFQTGKEKTGEHGKPRVQEQWL